MKTKSIQNRLHTDSPRASVYLFILILVPILMVLNGCTKTEKESYFQTVLEHYGHSKFSNSKIHYRSRNLVYDIDRSGYRTKIQVTRKSKDSTVYKTIYENGSLTEFIDGKKQIRKEYPFAMVISSIESSVFSSTIPHVFTTNDFQVKQLDDQQIRNKMYNVLLAETKFVEDIDIHRFYLYIDKETNDIMFTSQDYNVESGKYILKRYFNHRTIDGLRFADYQPFIPKDPTMELPNLINRFNADYFKPLKEVTFKEISVFY